ncbi:prenyltransferase [Haloarcula sp. S1CR25-12]|uniref:Prenyltransferase n=1 Tax=Haloarcula saliterrae TaxID=2950534 RepID=A0ABU2FBV0_9EURY|nr:prenyltransferase [Haloarcula sp. S1CR25-12]MDS0259321.1 prenyltransferase [Haloarcula sp. S1CR25-12]
MSVTDRLPRLWTLWSAARPSQIALIGLVYALGIGMARALTPAAVPWTHVAVGGAVLVPVALSVHYANEFADVETDRMTERTPFSGGSGALERTGVSRGLLARASGAALAAGVSGGVVGWLAGLVSTTALALLTGIAGLGLAYSLPPVALVRRGVGELTNAVLGGTLLPLYGVAVVGRVSPATVLAVLPFTVLVGCNLLATHWPDREADAAVGKRTLAVRWSPRRLRGAYWTLAAVAVLVTVGLAGRVLPVTVVTTQTLALPPLLWGGIVLTRQRSPFPAVAAMVVHAGASTAAWWWLALG